MDKPFLGEDQYRSSVSHPPSGRGYLASAFFKHGLCIARNPVLTMIISALVVGSCSLGLTMLSISSSPDSIWVPPGSQTSVQETYFGNAFDPFYRIEQVIFTPHEIKGSPGSILDNNVLTPAVVQSILRFQQIVANSSDSTGTTLADLCYRPIAGKGCLIESVTNFMADDPSVISSLTPASLQSYLLCRELDSSFLPCTAGNGVPAMPEVAIGAATCSAEVPGAISDSVCSGTCPGRAAQALMSTWLLNAGPMYDDRAARWEKEVFLQLAQQWEDPVLNVSFMAQRSVEDQIGVVASQNSFVVVVSYIAMFCYIVVAMGKFPHPVRSRALLGLSGITLVATSVSSAIGLWSYGGGEITMIVSEVVPFLILAIGVDNMFIITKTADRIRARRVHSAMALSTPSGEATPGTSTGLEPPTPVESSSTGIVPVERLMGDVLAEVGPSITAAASAEVLAFAMGAATNIPALRQFCAVASIAVLIDYVMQITWFVAAVTLDFERMDRNLVDCCPCFCTQGHRDPMDDTFTAPKCRFCPGVGMPLNGWCGSGTATPGVDGERQRHSLGRFWACVHRGEYARACLTRSLSPVLMITPVRLLVLAAWIAALGGSLYGASQLHLGLEQQLAVPQTSYLYDYFNQQAALGDAGPPVYVVLQNLNYSDASNGTAEAIAALTDGLSTLSEDIVPPVYSWYNQFLQWSTETTWNDIHSSPDQSKVCPLPLYTTNYTLGARVEQFLYDIPIDSACCQDYAHCYAQFEADVKLLWVSSRPAVDAALQAQSVPHPRVEAQTNLARDVVSGGTGPRELRVWHSEPWEPAGNPSDNHAGILAGSRAEAAKRLMASRIHSPQRLLAFERAAKVVELWRRASKMAPFEQPSFFLTAASREHLELLNSVQDGELLLSSAQQLMEALTPITVMTSRLRTTHTALRDQTDFVRAMEATQAAVHRLAQDIPMVDPAAMVPPGVVVESHTRGIVGNQSDNEHLEWLAPAPSGPDNKVEAAWPYSLFYVYYEQYDYIRGVAVSNVLVALAAAYMAVLLVTSPAVALFVGGMVLCVTIDVIGFVWALNPSGEDTPLQLLAGIGKEAFGVDINAVSVVNLVTAVGLAVEFNVHIASYFTSASGTRIVRAQKALGEMGSAVVTGITLTKFVGVLVLGWAPSQIFQLYYFRMYMAIIVAGAFHGLLVLPVLLSFFGPASVHEVDYIKDATTGKLRERLVVEYHGELSHVLQVHVADSESDDEDTVTNKVSFLSTVNG
jgi:hypothetical protein